MWAMVLAQFDGLHNPYPHHLDAGLHSLHIPLNDLHTSGGLSDLICELIRFVNHPSQLFKTFIHKLSPLRIKSGGRPWRLKPPIDYASCQSWNIPERTEDHYCASFQWPYCSLNILWRILPAPDLGISSSFIKMIFLGILYPAILPLQ
jgi:hypothetical protein